MSETTAMRRLARIERVFHEAIERPEGERGAYLDEACGTDIELRHEVEQLLEQDSGRIELLDSAPWKRNAGPRELEVAAGPLAQPGARIGRYRLLEQIAAGGMGTVWVAERADRHYEQRAAVKLIKRGMDTDDILRRFRTERQVLAGLEHANIARLLDGGATEDGRPYLVMEYVGGRPIDEYCQARELSLRARIAVFIKVCRAVQVAHRNLVIHRDLKPANILVTDEGEPKLLDFGIAKLLSAEGAAVTATGLRVMTLLYASPEQVRGDRITTATDVYSLGVILYVLLAGRGPYELDTEASREIERAVLFREPRRPSTVAGCHGIAGDLDTIVLKALSKEPERRYGSPEQLADDLQRYLDGLPILARPSGVGTRLVKALRRNRRAVAAALAGAAISVVVAAMISVYVFVVPAWVQEHVDAARLELLDTAQSNGIYVSVYWHDAGAGGRPSPDALRRAVSHYDTALRLYPTRGDIRLERDIVRAALEQNADFDGTRLDDRSRGLLAMLLGDFKAGFEAWSRLDLVSNPDPLVEGLLGILYLALDEPARAYPRLTRAYQAYPEVGFLCVSLADAAVHSGDVELAIRLIDRAQRLHRTEDGTGGLTRVRADVLAATGRYDEAATLYLTEAPAGARGSPVAWLHCADMRERQGRHRESLAILAEAVGFVSRWQKINRIYCERAERWWAALGAEERQSLIEAAGRGDPTDRESFAFLLFAYRAATLSLQRAGPPVDPTGRAAYDPDARPIVSPSLDQLSSGIRVIDLEAWVYVQRGLARTDSGSLSDRILLDFGGPEHALSPQTRRALVAWQRRYPPHVLRGFYGRNIGFTTPPGGNPD